MSPWHAMFVNVGPFVIFAGVFVVLIFAAPWQMRRLYRRDPAMQGEFTVDVTTDGFSMSNTAGTSFKAAWKVYEYWAEGKNVVLLMNWQKASFVLSVRELSGPQRDQLRGILTQVLPKR